MLRRPPTSIELKLDDIREYELVRHQLAEERKKNKSFSEAPAWQPGPYPKSKEEVYARIGYVPDKAASTCTRTNSL